MSYFGHRAMPTRLSKLSFNNGVAADFETRLFVILTRSDGSLASANPEILQFAQNDRDERDGF
jgi:hypothetical protein